MYADFNCITNNNINYTVDMLRLRTNLTYEEFSKIEYRIKTIYQDIVKDKYQSTGISNFKYNYVIELKENSSYWFGFIHNAELTNGDSSTQNSIRKYNFTVEFNPNKVDVKGLLKYILSISKDWTIKSIDMAMDIKVNILDICGLDKGRKKDFRVFSCGYDNKTYYMGRSDNRIKIYNKKIESNLEYDLTRVEITSKIDFKVKDILFYSYDVKLPDLYLNNYLYTFKDYEDRTLLAILYAVQSGFNINDLSRRYRDKVKGLLEGNYKINLDNKYCTAVLQQCITAII